MSILKTSLKKFKTKFYTKALIVYFIYRVESGYKLTSVKYKNLKEMLLDNCSCSEDYIKNKVFFDLDQAQEVLTRLNSNSKNSKVL